jgi:ubiquitin carboxyl-terminal hydrolase 9/13
LNELHELFKNISSAKSNRGIVNHRRFIARIRAGNALFNNDEHHDSHEFISWLIDEIHMNIHEDFRFYLKKRIQSKDYQKEFNKFINSIEPLDQGSHPLYKLYIEETANGSSSPTKNLFEKMKESNDI